MLFTNLGLVYWLKVYEIPEMSRTSKGRALVNILSLREGERVTELFPVKEFEEDGFLLMATARGRVKKTTLNAFGKRGVGGIIAVKLPKDDRLVGVRRTTGQDEVVLVTSRGRAIRFKEADVRAMGRTAGGVRGVRLKKGDSVVDVALTREGATLLTVCQNGFGKRTAFDHYPTHRRGGLGVVDILTTKRNGPVVAAREVAPQDEIMVMSEGGKMIRLAASTIRRTGRHTKGVRIVRLDEGDRVTAVARVLPEDGQAEESAPPAPPERDAEA
jgi:DNA gyrase subunit A